MTTDVRAAVVCPSWCENGSAEYPCKGEHLLIAPPVVCTTDDDRRLEDNGMTLPIIGLMITQGAWVGSSDAGIDVDIRRPSSDATVRLTPDEATRLAEELMRMVALAGSAPVAERSL